MPQDFQNLIATFFMHLSSLSLPSVTGEWGLGEAGAVCLGSLRPEQRGGSQIRSEPSLHVSHRFWLAGGYGWPCLQACVFWLRMTEAASEYLCIDYKLLGATDEACFQPSLTSSPFSHRSLAQSYPCLRRHLGFPQESTAAVSLQPMLWWFPTSDHLLSLP